jgi:hypothetical protein
MIRGGGGGWAPEMTPGQTSRQTPPACLRPLLWRPVPTQMPSRCADDDDSCQVPHHGVCRSFVGRRSHWQCGRSAHANNASTPEAGSLTGLIFSETITCAGGGAEQRQRRGKRGGRAARRCHRLQGHRKAVRSLAHIIRACFRRQASKALHTLCAITTSAGLCSQGSCCQFYRKREEPAGAQDEVIVLSSDSDEETSRPAQRHQVIHNSA